MDVVDQKKPTVSIILPIHNAGSLLHPQVDSILSQTYSSWELLLVDDGSTDESSRVAKEYADYSPLVHFKRNEFNRGLQETINQVVGWISGDLVAFSDHDDVWEPDKIARQVAYLVSHSEVACVFSDRTVIDVEGRELCTSEYSRIGTPPEVADTQFLLRSMARYTHANTMMFRRKLIDFIFPIPCGWDWWIGTVASWFGPVAFMRDQLVRYRVYKESLSDNERLYLRRSRSCTTRAQVRANIRRQFEFVTSLYEHALRSTEFAPPLLLIKKWLSWYDLLLELLSHPTRQAYWQALSLLPCIGRKREALQLTLYALPHLHETYLRLAGRFRGY